MVLAAHAEPAPVVGDARTAELLEDLSIRVDGAEDETEKTVLRAVARDTLKRLTAPGDELIDVEEMLAKYETYRTDHIVHDTLAHMIAMPYLLHRPAEPGAAQPGQIVAVVRFGKGTRGHPRLVHGGAVALTFDNLLGWLVFLSGQTNVFTASLKIDYVKPLQTDSTVLVTVGGQPPDGRKLWLHGRITSLDGDTVYQNATSLFVIPRSATAVAEAGTQHGAPRESGGAAKVA